MCALTAPTFPQIAAMLPDSAPGATSRLDGFASGDVAFLLNRKKRHDHGNSIRCVVSRFDLSID